MNASLNQSIKESRQRSGVSQRVLARKASLAFKSLQLVERDGHDPKLSTLNKIAIALGRRDGGPSAAVRDYFSRHAGDLRDLSSCLVHSHTDWRFPFFNFIDDFRRAISESQPTLLDQPPVSGLAAHYMGLLASTAETLCQQQALAFPWWTAAVIPLATPWFVANVENLKVTALLESPIHYRKRNIFVLENFLDRA